MFSHLPMGVMRVFQLPLVAKYCCVAKAQPATSGSTDTDEKSPNLHLSPHPVTTPPVASTVPGPATEIKSMPTRGTCCRAALVSPQMRNLLRGSSPSPPYRAP